MSASKFHTYNFHYYFGIIIYQYFTRILYSLFPTDAIRIFTLFASFILRNWKKPAHRLVALSRRRRALAGDNENNRHLFVSLVALSALLYYVPHARARIREPTAIFLPFARVRTRTCTTLSRSSFAIVTLERALPDLYASIRFRVQVHVQSVPDVIGFHSRICLLI